MSNERVRKVFKADGKRVSGRASLSGVDRASCAWRDAVGPGYAVGLTEGVARAVSGLGSTRYCR